MDHMTIGEQLYALESVLKKGGLSDEWIKVILEAHLHGITPDDLREIISTGRYINDKWD